MMTHHGTVEEEYSSFEFSRFYPDQDFYIIHSTVLELIRQPGISSPRRCAAMLTAVRTMSST